ncbi:TniQ family protein [Thiomicrorhabdus sp. Kp2]|uniref:TniQ family protein n=1 Tax=Thiomicrorhabdus sp. Kp2 TaxID=1123518 RepID=UPI00041E1706|nr:TniQ family protein [Thiomicrorhabdus sp. Kp2]
MKLLFSDSRKPDECVASYLIRTAENNGFRRVSHLLNHTDLHWKNSRLPIPTILSGKVDVDTLLSQLGLEPIGKTKLSEFHDLFRKKTDTPKILSKHPKVCPLCLKENGYAKESWNLLPVTACTKHNIMLIDSNNNGRMLSWYRPYLALYDHKKPIENIIKAPTALIELSKLFERFVDNPSARCKTNPVLFKGLTANECLSILNFIAHFQAKAEVESLLMTQNNISIASQYQKAYPLIKKWPDQFHELLSNFASKPMTDLESQGIRKHFRTLHDQLHLQRENKGIERIKEAFERYLLSNWPTALNESRLKRISIKSSEKQQLSIMEACKLLNCRTPKISHLAQIGILTEYEFKGKKYYERIEIEQHLKTVSNNWSFQQACDKLNISKTTLKRLISRKIIAVVMTPSEQNRDWLIDKKKTINLINKLKRNAYSKNNPTKCYSFQGFLKLGNSYEDTLCMMLKQQIAYKFHSDQENPYGLHQFIIYKP